MCLLIFVYATQAWQIILAGALFGAAASIGHVFGGVLVPELFGTKSLGAIQGFILSGS